MLRKYGTVRNDQKQRNVDSFVFSEIKGWKNSWGGKYRQANWNWSASTHLACSWTLTGKSGKLNRFMSEVRWGLVDTCFYFINMFWCRSTINKVDDLGPMMLGIYIPNKYCILIKNFRFIIFIKYLYKIKKGLWYNGKKTE